MLIFKTTQCPFPLFEKCVCRSFDTQTDRPADNLFLLYKDLLNNCYSEYLEVYQVSFYFLFLVKYKETIQNDNEKKNDYFKPKNGMLGLFK